MFSKARLAHALWFALDSDSMTAAAEAAYEARAATDDLEGVIRVVMATVGD